MNILLWIIIGGLAGWAASSLMKAKTGLIADIVIGIVGAFIGGFVLDLLDLSSDGTFIGSLVTAFIGAVILLWIIRQLRK